MPQAAPPIDRPELTFDPDVSAFVEDHYDRAKVILEFGSGGSTVLASEMPGKTIFSVESDKSWAQMMQSWFDYAQPVSMPFVQHVNVDKTGKWGTPIDGTAFRRFMPDYPVMFRRNDVLEPDERAWMDEHLTQSDSDFCAEFFPDREILFQPAKLTEKEHAFRRGTVDELLNFQKAMEVILKLATRS